MLEVAIVLLITASFFLLLSKEYLYVRYFIPLNYIIDLFGGFLEKGSDIAILRGGFLFFSLVYLYLSFNGKKKKTKSQKQYGCS